MAKKLKDKLKKALFRKELVKLGQLEISVRVNATQTRHNRRLIRNLKKEPIRVIFFCHEPSLWSMFDSVYRAMESSEAFAPIVFCSPYQHNSLAPGQFKDAGMYEFGKSKNLNVECVYDAASDTWKKPQDFEADYIFFQTPYSVYPREWDASNVHHYFSICYIPYATSLFKGEVDETLHPQSFFQYVDIAFKEAEITAGNLKRRFEKESWFNLLKIVATGHPKLEKLTGGPTKTTSKSKHMHALWTPRWNTKDACCSFFEYINYFDTLEKRCDDIHLTLRPHPLCFQNFISTGELTEEDINSLKANYERSPLKHLDESPNYKLSFDRADVLITDVSSMMLEFFVTGKPIVYTHKKNVFNELGGQLAEGFYWVKNETELEKTLLMLKQGSDPLKEKREEILREILPQSELGASHAITQFMLEDAAYTA